MPTKRQCQRMIRNPIPYTPLRKFSPESYYDANDLDNTYSSRRGSTDIHHHNFNYRTVCAANNETRTTCQERPVPRLKLFCPLKIHNEVSIEWLQMEDLCPISPVWLALPSCIYGKMEEATIMQPAVEVIIIPTKYKVKSYKPSFVSQTVRRLRMPDGRRISYASTSETVGFISAELIAPIATAKAKVITDKSDAACDVITYGDGTLCHQRPRSRKQISSDQKPTISRVKKPSSSSPERKYSRKPLLTSDFQSKDEETMTDFSDALLVTRKK